MALSREAELNETIRLIRLCFHRLGTLGDELHRHLQITAAMRGVMESLFTDGPQTVPQIAGTKSVSRQHIQKLADALAKRKIVLFEANPGHKRSSLLALTKDGDAIFRKMQQREAMLLQELASAMGQSDVTSTNEALALLDTVLESGLKLPDKASSQ